MLAPTVASQMIHRSSPSCAGRDFKQIGPTVYATAEHSHLSLDKHKQHALETRPINSANYQCEGCILAKTLPTVDLWTVKEAATYLRISVKWMYEIVRIPETAGGPPVCRPIGFPIRTNRKHRNGDWKAANGAKRTRRSPIRIPREKFIEWAMRKDHQCSA